MSINQVGSQSIIEHLGNVVYYDNFISTKEASCLYKNLEQNLDWLQFPITIFGKTYLQPRLIAFEGDVDVSYSYSKTTLKALGWSSEVAAIKQRCEQLTQKRYNCVLINYYRDGNDSMGWHSDDEKELGSSPSIASVSIGAERFINFRRREDHQQKLKLCLSNGSLLHMAGATQTYWQHQIAKSKRVQHGRINLTFRNILP